MATTPKGGSSIYSNPPVGDMAFLGSTGPLDSLKGKSMVSPYGTTPTNDFSKVKAPGVIRRK